MQCALCGNHVGSLVWKLLLGVVTMLLLLNFWFDSDKNRVLRKSTELKCVYMERVKNEHFLLDG